MSRGGRAALTLTQNERVRTAVAAWRARNLDVRTTKDLERLAGVTNLSDWLNRKAGISFQGALALAKLLEVDVADMIGPPEPREGERLYGVTYGPPTAGPTSAAERMHALTFVHNVRRMSGLEAWITNHPTEEVTVAALAEAMLAWDDAAEAERDASDDWWTRFLARFAPITPDLRKKASGNRSRFAGT